MKQIAVVIFLIFAGCLQSFSQSKQKIDTTAIYAIVINEIEPDGLQIYIPTQLSLRELKQFKFKNIDDYLLLGTKFPLYKNTEWHQFLTSIDTGLIKGGRLSSKLNSKYVKVVEPKSTGFKKIFNDSTTYGLVIFSPVIISGDRKKAVVTRQEIQGPEAQGTTMFFLERKDKKWSIVSQILISIS